MYNKYDLMVIGNVPPPVGGVSIHVQRLLDSLKQTDIVYKFYRLRQVPILKIFGGVFNAKIIHLHTSNVYFTFFFSLWCFIFRRKLIMTYHGNLNRYGYFKNLLDHVSIRMIWLPIVINKLSYDMALKLNKNSKLLTAFIPPLKVTELEDDVVCQIARLKSRYKYIFSTNAFNLSYDKNGREIYQVTAIAEIFNTLTDCALIISDPSSAYQNYFKLIDLELNSNILLLPFVHDFNSVINKSDCFIRFTTTDGDSLSIKEALHANVAVITTNVVDRPKGVILVDDSVGSLKMAVVNFKPVTGSRLRENCFDKLLPIYTSSISSNLS